MVTGRTGPQAGVDVALDVLGQDARTEFLELISYGASERELSRWLSDRGHDVSQVCVGRWIRNYRRETDKTIRLGTTMSEYRAINPADAMRFSLAIAANNLDRINEEIALAVQAGAPLADIISLERRLATLIKEVRTSAEKTQQAKYVHDRDELQLTGVEILASVLREMFRGTPSEPVIETAISSAISKIIVR
jgi:hypothetical protein